MNMTSNQLIDNQTVADPETGEQVLGDFADLVASILKARSLTPEDYTEAVDLITTSHRAQVDYLTRELEESKNATAAYAAMDRANQSVMQFTKRTIGSALEINARQHAYSEGLAVIRAEALAVVRAAAGAGQDTIPTGVMQAYLEKSLEVPTPAPPVIVGMATDTRWSHGVFHPQDGSKDVILPFIGWSLVIRHPRINAGLEPTFLSAQRQAATSMALTLDGLDLIKLY